MGRRSGAAASSRAADPGDALGCDEVREGSVGIGRGEVDHALAQRREEHRRRLSAGTRPPVDGRSVRGEVLAHPRHRTVERLAVKALAHVRVAHAQTEHEATGRGLRQRLGRDARGLRIMAPDADDARAEDQAVRRSGQQAEERERLATDRLGHPERPVAEVLGTTGEGARRVDRERVEMTPDAEAPELGTSHGATNATPPPRTDTAGTARRRGAGRSRGGPVEARRGRGAPRSSAARRCRAGAVRSSSTPRRSALPPGTRR